jgi:hypothetical protein
VEANEFFGRFYEAGPPASVSLGLSLTGWGLASGRASADRAYVEWAATVDQGVTMTVVHHLAELRCHGRQEGRPPPGTSTSVAPPSALTTRISDPTYTPS